MKKAKIIATIGPKSANEETLSKMINCGMDCARVNFSHGTDEQHINTINLVKSVREKLKKPVAILLDTKGPEFRIGLFKNGKEILKDGQDFTFCTNKVDGDSSQVSVSYKNMAKELSVGDIILVNNGLLKFEVKSKTKNKIVTKVINGGVISNNKSMNFPNKIFNYKYLSEQDKHDIKIGLECGVDYIACSFVSKASDLIEVNKFVKACGVDDVSIIAKIENQTGVDNINSILELCDGIMIGRGDLGVEIAQEKLPTLQKQIIRTCILKNKIVITATEMLESMITSTRPTRAETSDVANAVYDGSTAVMLSAETAVGNHPDLCVKTMSTIIEETEKHLNYVKILNRLNKEFGNNLEATSMAVAKLAHDTKAEAIVACSKTGKTIKNVAGFKPAAPILGLITDKKEYNKLSLYYGVIPAQIKDYNNLNKLFDKAKEMAKSYFNIKNGRSIIITGGTSNMVNTNLIKVEMI